MILISREEFIHLLKANKDCLLYTSDAADERSSVDLGGRRIIKKKQYSFTFTPWFNHYQRTIYISLIIAIDYTKKKRVTNEYK